MITCPSCGEQNPDRARLCMMCGTQLAAAEQTGRRERRVVSVLFCDLVGFTSRSEQQDIEDVEGFLSGYHQLLRRELERHGGMVEKFIGDAVMALFGAPTAHEDDAERAVRAALAIQEAVADLRAGGADVHVRVGVTTGEALVALGADPTRGEGMASGDVVNTAARVQAAAAPDGVLVDEATHRATDRAIRYAQAEPITAKGKADPVPVWRALETRSMLPEQVREDDLPLVGRKSEAGLLTAALDRSQSDPSTQLVTVVGAPGIGKSRLVQELRRHVDELPGLIRWRRGRSLAYGEGVAFWALGEMVKAQAGILESDSREAAAEKLGDAVAANVIGERDREWVARHLRPLVGLEAAAGVSAEGSRVEAFAAWRRFFEAMAEDGPTVLIFEDVHWADDALVDFIDLLADRAGAVPLLIVCTARPEFLERRQGWGGGKMNALAINLAPLSADDTARLIGELLDQALLPAATQQALLERAEGNPLYAQEYVRMLRDQGLLAEGAGGWELTGDPEGLPDSVQAIIAARLDTLTEEERAFVQDASVVGRTAWLGVIGTMTDRSAWELDELLHGLERKQLVIRARRSSVEGEVEFGFAHALTQEVAYSRIRRTDRAHRHERAAEWVERLAGERDDKAELLAHHYLAALELRRQTGEDVRALEPKLRTALAEAGRRAQAVNAYATAARHLAGALELTQADDPARPRLLLDHATCAFHAGIADAGTLRAALDVHVAQADWPAAAAACLILGRWLDSTAGLAEQADEVNALGFDYATRDGYTPTASQIARGRALRLVVTGHAAEAIPFTEEVIRQAEAAGDEEGRALMQLWHGDARITTGDLTGIEEMRDAADTLAGHSHPGAAVAHNNLSESLVAIGDYPGAAAARAEAGQWAERFGEAFAIGQATAGHADALFHAGDWNAALTAAAPVTSHSSAQLAAYARWITGRIVLARGDSARAMGDAHPPLEYGERSGNHELLYYGLVLLALAHHAERHDAQVATACGRVFELWHGVGGMLSSANVVAELAPIASQRAAIGDAAALLPEGRWRIALTAVADDRFGDAADMYAQMGSRQLEAMAHLLAAQDGDGTARDEHARRAQEFYEAVGATGYAAQAAALRRGAA